MGELDDDLDMDRFLLLTEEQQEAEFQAEMQAYSQWYDNLPLVDQIAHRRRTGLSACRATRRLIHLAGCPDIIRQDAQRRLKAAQIRLLKIRMWRTTGVRPGEA